MDQDSRIFALKLKAFFHALRGENQKKEEMLARIN
jgi:hypothetical protein